MTLKEKIANAIKEEGLEPKAFLLVADCGGKVMSLAEGSGTQIVNGLAQMLTSDIPHAAYLTEAVEFAKTYQGIKKQSEAVATPDEDEDLDIF